ncbi:MAG: hypothetical protein FJ368_06925, partial [Pelagibacterales bacterium]|nr:hypothetical protein [Pelagibacterales bacterium]
MAKKQALGSLFTGAIKNTKQFQEALSELKTEVQQIAKLEEKKISLIDIKTVEGIKELEKQLKTVSELTKGYKSVLEQEKKVKKELEEQNKKLAFETDEELKAKQRYNQAMNEQRKNIKALLDLEKAQKGSIDELKAKLKLLTMEVKSHANETENDKKKIKELNDAIKQHKEQIKEQSKGYQQILAEEQKAKKQLEQQEARLRKQQEAEAKKREQEAKKNKVLTAEELKEREKHNQALALERRLLALNVKMEQAEAGSIDQLRAKVALLTIERNKLKGTTEEEIKLRDALNKQIDEHNELIEKNVDVLTQQKMNVGNYTDSIRKAIEGLSGNNQALGLLVTGWEKANSALTGATNIFSNLKAEFQAVKASIIANTVATNVNTEATTTNTVATEAQTVATEANTVATNLNTRAIFRMIFSLRGLKIALASTGIGLVILALTGLVGMFSQGISGTLRFNRVMGALGAGLKNVFSGLVTFSQGLFGLGKDLYDGFTLFFKRLSLQIALFIAELTNAKLADIIKKELQQVNKDLTENGVEFDKSIKNIIDGFMQLTKTSEVMASAYDGAITSMIRKIEILKATVNLSELQKQYQTMAEFAEDDTVD